MQKKDKSRKLKCFSCGKAGHFRHDCPRRDEQDYLRPTHKAKAVEETCLDLDSDSDTDGAFAVSVDTMDSNQMGSWLVDSGASSHMTREKELLTDYREFEKSEKVGQLMRLVLEMST